MCLLQIMDGSPSRGEYFNTKILPDIRRRTVINKSLVGETIPIRLFLGGFDLTPTFREVNKKYSTRYYLSLVLIDEGKRSCSLPLICNSFPDQPFPLTSCTAQL